MATGTNLSLQNLPPEMIDKILSYLSYDQIAKLRAVNRTFNNICSDKLNKGFGYVEQFHNKCLKAVKTKLPRRESERRHHPLARHSDILMAVETRLSMLSMTFTRYIDARQCCFIPGKVLDEALKVLRIVSMNSIPVNGEQYPFLPRPHDFLQEYRDVSSMAMEHFDDKILPGIKEKMKIRIPRVYHVFKTGQVRNQMLEIQDKNVPVQALKRSMTPRFSVTGPKFAAGRTTSEVESSELLNVPASLKPIKLLQKTNIKCNRMHKHLLTLHLRMKCISKKMKLENILLKNQVAQQRSMIKRLRRELISTKNAMTVMSKDIYGLKMGQLSKGTKRKNEGEEEDTFV